MADTPVTLGDVFFHDVYGSYFAIDDVETSAFYRAGIIATDAAFDVIAKAGGKQATIPFWKDLDQTIEPNYSNDDITDTADMNNISTGTQTARKAWVNQIFGDMDLVTELIAQNPMERIRARFSEYWVRQLQRRLIAQITGVLADNVANDSSDMIIDISGLSGSAAIFNSDAFIDAAYTLGDHADSIRAIAVHSMIEARMVKNDEIVYVPDSQGNLTIKTYKGRVVVIDDLMPKTGSGSDTIFTSILFGAGAVGFGGVNGHAFAYGEGIPKNPVELHRLPTVGNGGGAEELIERNTWLMHPFGFTWIEAAPLDSGEFSPSLSDLRLAKHWDRVVDRKLVPVAFVKSKG